MARKEKIRVHISLVGGEWYAASGNGNAATRQALVPAIHFCDQLNAQQGRGQPLAKKLAGRRWAAEQGAR